MNSNLLTLPGSTAAIHLDDATRDFLENSKAPNTKIAYARAWKDFLDYCDKDAGANALPATPQTVAAYLGRLGTLPIKVSTIEQRLAAIAFMHRTANLEDPTVHSVVRGVMSGIRRTRAEMGETPRQAEPLLREDLQAIVTSLGTDPCGLRDKALLLLQWALARRQSEVVALDVRDIEFRTKGMRVTIRRSKTDQEGAGVLKQVERLSEEHAALCPVRALRAWLAISKIADGPLFRKVDRWGHVGEHRMNARSVAYLIDRSVERVGLDPALYSGHSSRSGFATQADLDGRDTNEIQNVTDHKSGDMMRRYLRRRGARQSKTIKQTLEGAS